MDFASGRSVDKRAPGGKRPNDIRAARRCTGFLILGHFDIQIESDNRKLGRITTKKAHIELKMSCAVYEGNNGIDFKPENEQKGCAILI